MPACPLSSSLAAADSSAVAEVVCTTEEIWSSPWEIWAMESACSWEALAIFSTRPRMRPWLPAQNC